MSSGKTARSACRPHRNKRRQGLRAAAAAAVIALALGGTGVPASAAGTVKIGVLVPLSGNFAPNGQQTLTGIQMYLDQIHHMADGTKLDVLVEDENGKPDVAVTKARKLVERDGAQILTGIISSGVALAVNDFSRDNKVPLVLSGDAGADELTMPGPLANPYLVRVSQDSRTPAAVAADWAYKKKGWRKVTLVGSDYAGGVGVMFAFARSFCQLGGKVAQVQWPPLSTADYGPYITNLDRNTDAMVSFTPGAAGLRLGRQYAEFGLKLPIMDIYGTIVYPPNLPQLGTASLGMFSSLFYAAALKTPINERFVKEFEKRMHTPPGNEGPNGYVGAEAIARAVAAVHGNLQDKMKFMAALKAVHFDTPKGPISLDKYGQVVQSMYIRRVEKVDGRYENVPIATYHHVDQFWPYSAKEFASFKYTYKQMKGSLTDCAKLLAKK